MNYFDELEVRTADERAASLAECLPALLAEASDLPGYVKFREYDLCTITSAVALERLPVLRKSELGAAQKMLAPFGGFVGPNFEYAFQSPGPLYEPGRTTHDWWRFGRFLHATGIGQGDIIQNCFSYHLTPAGTMFEKLHNRMKVKKEHAQKNTTYE